MAKRKHNCMTFPFNLEKKSICTLCRADDCTHFTMLIGRRGGAAGRFILQSPICTEIYTGEDKRRPGTMYFNEKEVHGRLEDLMHLARNYRVICLDKIRDNALSYILGVDECQGFKKLGHK